MKWILVSVIGCIVLGGCVSTQKLDMYASDDIELVNQRLNGYPATIHMMDESFNHGRELVVRTDSTYWIEQGTKQERSIATTEIHAIEAAVFRRSLFSRKAFGIGFAAGYMSMAVADLSREDPARMSEGQMFLTLGVGFATGVLGSLLFGRRAEANRSVGRFILNEHP